MRNAPPTEAVLKKAAKLSVDVAALMEWPIQRLRKEVARLERAKWDCQKVCEDERTEWLKELAKDRARAENDPDWESK